MLSAYVEQKVLLRTGNPILMLPCVPDGVVLEETLFCPRRSVYKSLTSDNKSLSLDHKSFLDLGLQVLSLSSHHISLSLDHKSLTSDHKSFSLDHKSLSSSLKSLVAILVQGDLYTLCWMVVFQYQQAMFLVRSTWRKVSR